MIAALSAYLCTALLVLALVLALIRGGRAVNARKDDPHGLPHGDCPVVPMIFAPVHSHANAGTEQHNHER